MKAYKKLQKEIKKKLRRGYVVDAKHPHYEKFTKSGGLMKKFPVVLDWDLKKHVRSAMHYPRAEQRRICKYLFGHLSGSLWSKWTEARRELLVQKL